MNDQADLAFNQHELGHGASGTVLHPIVLVALLIAIALILRRPRKYIALPLLVCVFLIPRAQEVYLLGLHWYVRLILLLVGFIRFTQARYRIPGGLNRIDKLFLMWVSYRVVAVIATNWPNGALEQAYFWIQACCGYFLLRYLIQNESDINRISKALAVVSLILGLCMLTERFEHVNIFGYLGGAPLHPEVRNGTIRAQATFGHPILAGCFGATLLPLFFWLWKRGKNGVLAAVGMMGSTLMVATSNSSTPVLAYAAGVLALCLWPLRRYTRVMRWGIVAALGVLALVMKAPVWYVVAHVNVVGGSGGYDRALLIDVFMKHFSDWWFIGTNQNGNWGYDMWDLSNQFVAEGEMGGLVTLVCFIAMISYCFGRLGTMRRRVDPNRQWLCWCLGAVMLAHIFAYFGVAYWDQSQIWWFAFLAMVSSATTVPKTPRPWVQRPSVTAVFEPLPSSV